MGLYDMKAFYRFLENASDEELLERKKALLKFIEDVDAEEVISDARYLVKKIESEILARINLQ